MVIVDIHGGIYTLESTKYEKSGNYLSGLPLEEFVPSKHLRDVLDILAESARRTNSISWLERAFWEAISHASPHMDVVFLNLQLILLHEIYARARIKAEGLIGKVGEIASLERQSPVFRLEECRSLIALEYGQIYVRMQLLLDSRLLEDASAYEIF